MWRRFCLPRRMVLSAVACLLAVVWLGNAAMTVWLREAASDQTLRVLLSFGFTLYAGWHLTKSAFFRPEIPLDCSTAERELLAACPLRPRDLVEYQLAAVAVPTLLKAALFAMLLLPDLQSLPLGVCGILLGMYLLEVLRMAVELVAWGVARSTYLVYRTCVVAGLIALGVWSTWWFVREGPVAGRINIGEGVLDRFVEILVQLGSSPLGYATVPFRPFVELIVAETLTIGSAAWAVAAVAIVAALSAAVVRLYGTLERRRAAREHKDYAVLLTRTNATLVQSSAPVRPLRRVWRMGGVGALAWRQLVGARRHWGSLATAMVAPAVLAATPCFVVEDSTVAFLASAGAVAFYTFLLLPTAVRLDFRRDLDRLATLKGLPIRPAAVTIGQTLAPVLITTAFQAAVMAFAAFARGVPLHLLPVTLLILLPMNVFVFGLDNLIYLLYPYRIGQEGVEIFLRTMLTFTGKGMLFAVGLGVMSLWGVAAAAMSRRLETWTGSQINAHAIFATGMVAGMVLLAGLVLAGVCRTYRRLDPVEDVPR